MIAREVRTTVVTFRNIKPELINILFGGIVSGEVGYRAYGDSVGWKNYLGRPMPEWKDLPDAIRNAWDSAACAIVNEATRLYDQGSVGCACGHPAMMHDVAEASGEGSMCCVDGCGCGSAG